MTPFKQVPQGWVVENTWFKEALGFVYIANLIQVPHVGLSCSELRQMARGDFELTEIHSTQEMMDPVYRRQVLEAKKSLEGLDLESAESALSNATYAGRRKRFKDQYEKDRLSVGKAIRGALNKIISANDPETSQIGIELRDDLSLGGICTYRGAREWQFSIDDEVTNG